VQSDYGDSAHFEFADGSDDPNDASVGRALNCKENLVCRRGGASALVPWPLALRLRPQPDCVRENKCVMNHPGPPASFIDNRRAAAISCGRLNSMYSDPFRSITG